MKQIQISKKFFHKILLGILETGGNERKTLVDMGFEIHLFTCQLICLQKREIFVLVLKLPNP